MEQPNFMFRSDSLELKNEGENFFVEGYISTSDLDQVNDIVTISSSGNYSAVKSIDKKEFLVTLTMNEWDERLPEQKFCRISRTFIINFDFIEKTERWFNNTAMVYIQGYDEPFKLSKLYFKRLKNRYK